MKCKFCKEEIVDDSKFCPSCGRRLDDDDKLDYEDEENQTEENVDDSDENQEELNTDQDEE